MNRACFRKEKKTPEFAKMGEINELFVLALSLVWFAGATPDPLGNTIRTARITKLIPLEYFDVMHMKSLQ